MDALAALLTGKGVDHQVRRADQPVLHRRRRLDRQEFLHQWGVQTAAKLHQHCRAHKMLLGTSPLALSDSAGIHHRQVGPHPATDLLSGAGQRMFEEFQRS